MGLEVRKGSCGGRGRQLSQEADPEEQRAPGERSRAEGSGIGLREDGGGPVETQGQGRCWRLAGICRSSLVAGGAGPSSGHQAALGTRASCAICFPLVEVM